MEALTSQAALKYEAEVREEGRVELMVPLAPGTWVTIFVIEEAPDMFDDLLDAAQSTLAFWDSPYDDGDYGR